MSRVVSAVCLTLAIIAWLLAITGFAGGFYAAAANKHGELTAGITAMMCLMAAASAGVGGFVLFALAALFDSLDRIEQNTRLNRVGRLRLLDNEDEWAA